MKRPVFLLLCVLGLGCAALPAAARQESHGHRRADRHAHQAAHQSPHQRAASRHPSRHQASRHQAARHAAPARRVARKAVRHRALALNHSRVQRGHASVYARSLAGRRMADGTRFNPGAAVVASRTLPLGSHARVTNLRNGRTVVVQVRDRGPHTGGRIVDLSPGVASQLGMAGGVAPVEVAPITLASRAEAAPIRHR